MDRIARELQIDRVEVRNRNLIPKEKMPYSKQLRSRAGVTAVVDSGDYAAVPEKRSMPSTMPAFLCGRNRRAREDVISASALHMRSNPLAAARLSQRSFASRRRDASRSIPARWRWDRVSRRRWRSYAPSNWAFPTSRLTLAQATRARFRWDWEGLPAAKRFSPGRRCIWRRSKSAKRQSRSRNTFSRLRNRTWSCKTAASKFWCARPRRFARDDRAQAQRVARIRAATRSDTGPRSNITVPV